MDWLLHNSFEQIYRSPFGAAPCASKVRIRLRVLDSHGVDEVTLWAGVDGKAKKPLRMHKAPVEGDRHFYETTLELPDVPGLFFYYFSARREGRVWHYGRRPGPVSGRGELTEGVPPAWQITVFRPDLTIPEWFRHAVVYQVFVDRFHNGSKDGRVLNPKPESLIHGRWDNTPLYIQDPESRAVIRWDFFGGNLEGVRQKLAYLQNLGVTCLYLNPVFEAPSNHKYDTGDYHRIDPMFGDEETFRTLCREAGKRGIRVILDGVFSHTGSDSRYFNREGNYDSLGAYQSMESPYYRWYRFRHHPDDYESWWNVDVMPNVNELEPSYLDFIIRGPDSVLRHWMAAGASGWRLDVADELPDGFIRRFYETLKETDPEGLLIGEVWEDASNKVSYGARRPYLLGGMLDSVMNYPFREMVIECLTGQVSVRQTHLQLVTLREHYPKEHFYTTLNLVGSHDSPRILTALGEDWRKMRMAILWQMTFPGAPSIYYGDEAGLTGGTDPMNRKPFPWGRENPKIMQWTREAVALRRFYPVLTTGKWYSFYVDDTVYGYTRYAGGGQDVFGRPMDDNLVCVLFNADSERAVEGRADLSAFDCSDAMHDVFDNYREVSVAGGQLDFRLEPAEARVYIRDRWSRRETDRRCAGILLHPTSLPSDWGWGDLGAGARRFVDFLEESGQRIWQILPLGPAGYGRSPYMSPSAFAGNPMLIDPEDLERRGLLSGEELSAWRDQARRVSDPGESDALRWDWLSKAYDRFRESGTGQPEQQERFRTFCQQQENWLDDYSLFAALAEYYDGRPWTGWEPDVVRREPKILSFWRENLSRQIGREKFWQFLFWEQWKSLREYANGKGIRILGDLPIYVAHDSADVWARPELFRLDRQGNPTHVAGVPPDYFSADGQRWGNPLYDWEVHQREDYDWWAARIAHLMGTVDMVRIDHFRAFADYWEVPADEPTARVGTWQQGPGAGFFRRIEEKLGPVAFLAEDLGLLSREAVELKVETGLPGMQVLQFMLDDYPDRSWHLFLDQRDEVLYTGTHDNATLRQWLQGHKELPDDEQIRAVWSYIEAVHRTDADRVIVPLSDYLTLGPEGRMNTPGTTGGQNWLYRCTLDDLDPALSARIRSLTETYRRRGDDPLKAFGKPEVLTADKEQEIAVVVDE